MLLTEFVTRIMERIEQIDKQESADMDSLVRIESLLAFKALLCRVMECKEAHKSRPDAEANQQTLKDLIGTLKDRWSKIRLTDASYCHRPDTLANQVFLIVAEEIAKVTERKAYDYLMPSVNAAAFKTSKGALYDLQLHEFIFADSVPKSTSGSLSASSSTKSLSVEEIKMLDVGEPVEVLECLKNASKLEEFGVLKSTCSERKIKLIEAEVERVRYHSELTKSFFIDIKALSYNSTWSQLLEDAMNKKGYKVASSYGSEGKKRLLAIIMSMCDSRETLADTMASSLPKPEWRGFLQQVFQTLPRKIILHMDNFSNSLKDQNIYIQDAEYNTAVLFCFAYAYKHDRQQKGDHTTPYVPEFAHSLYGGYNKLEKLAAVDVLLDYLCSNRDMTLDEYQKTIPCPAGVSINRRELALNYDTLGEIANVVRARLSSAVTAAEQSGWRSLYRSI